MRIAGVPISQVPRLLFGASNPTDPARAIQSAAARDFCRSWTGGGLALLLLCLAVYLPGQVAIPPVDRDESRFAQASRQMYESGDFVVPRVQDRPRLNKPPLIYWLQCASIAVFGDREGQYPNANIWVFRVPSVLAAMASVFMTWRFGMRLFDPRAALLGAALLAVCPIVVWDAHQARADQLLLATVVATQWALYEVWRRVRNFRLPTSQFRLFPAIAFWIALGLGILAKGPITPLIAALTILALSITTRSWRWLGSLRPVLGVLIVFALVAPWVYAVGSRVGWSTYLSTIFDETLGRSAAPKEGHWGPPGYHTVLLVVLFWPGVLTTAAAVKRAWQRTFTRDTPPRAPTEVRGSVREAEPLTAFAARSERSSHSDSESRFRRFFASLRSARPSPSLFFLAWILPAWIFFELILTKLPHYTMPMYPAIALVSARTLLAADFSRLAGLAEAPGRLGSRVWSIVGVVAPLVVVVLFATYLQKWASGSVAIGGLLMFGVFFFVARADKHLRAGRILPAMGVGIAAQVGVVIAALGILLPFNFLLWPSRNVARHVQGRVQEPVAVVGFEEPSLTLWLRGRVRYLPVEALPEWMTANPRSAIIVARTPNSDANLIPECMGDRQPDRTIPGWNASTGSRLTFRVWMPDNP